MLPLAMDDQVQKKLREVGIDIDLRPIGGNALTQRFRVGFHTPEDRGLNAWNISWNEPWSGFGRFFHSKSVPPVAVNTMPYKNPDVDKLLEEAERTFDIPKQDALLATVHEIVVEDATWIFVAQPSIAAGYFTARLTAARRRGKVGRSGRGARSRPVSGTRGRLGRCPGRFAR